MESWTKDRMVEAAKQMAAACDGPLSKSAFCQRSGVSAEDIKRLFPKGGWRALCQRAGIKQHPKAHLRLTDDQLLQAFHQAVSQIGAIPTWRQFAMIATTHPDTLRNHFGSKQGTLERYREWLQNHHPESPLLQLLPAKATRQREGGVIRPELLSGGPQWSKGAGIVFGPPLHFRGLQHAPTNELAVVYLFGMVSSELGLLVEAIQPAYPDCQAKWCVDQRHNRWQAVRIEFEFCSSNFRDHGHNPTDCDLIVCWQHDWPECPLPVLELRSIIHQLEGIARFSPARWRVGSPAWGRLEESVRVSSGQ
jgi:hypothetical protein